jgi:2-amino-4-hydroxy-6-hydroxymethyldihydropteridine diphosphokinase
VLAPWNDIDPAAELPGLGAVGQLLATVGRDSVQARADVELRLPE